ncbi:hypothetical protein [Lyngbya confervoides]|uniref:Uncharacterized protein n=1 Tax=Lyngbya confervoides BDU141951 TaxID=1574623 RepID=A0ABD4T6F0_9CYAN|nr:hypothetical protein [Lyngbya confervoides]MCM1983815.1 hypothetical protein [Lyngbya confervoides BDU141951]
MHLDSYLRSYLEIPVVLGVALCQDKKPKYLFLDNQLNSCSEKIRLMGRLKEILLTTDKISVDGDPVEMPISNYYLYLYPLDEKHDFLTLVLHENNVIKSFRAKQLQRKLREDIALSLQYFQELSTKRSILGQHVGTETRERIASDKSNGKSNGKSNERDSDFTQENLSIDEVLTALNDLSRFVARYLGTKITSNYWNLAKPEDKYLSSFTIRYSAEISYSGQPSDSINPLGILALRKWTQSFMKLCYGVVNDMPERFEKEGINEKYRKIISIYTSDYLHGEGAVTGQEESLFGDLLI